MRRKAATWHQRQTFTTPVQRASFRDGPLDGIATVVEASTPPTATVGWCVITATGPVQLLYRPAKNGSDLAFAGLEGGPR